MPRSFLLPGAFIAVLLILGGGIWFYQSLQAPASSGEEKPGSGFFGSLFPFGSGAVTPAENGGGGSQEEENLGPVPSLRQVSDREVSGATFARGAGGAFFLRYVERETGHIYETPVSAWSSVRLTNTTVPAVQEALWVNASTTILRFIGEDGGVENFVGFFSSTTPDQSLQGTFIKNYQRIALAAGGAALYGVLEQSTGSTLEVVDLRGAAAPKTALVSTIRSWVPVAAGNSVFVATAPSAGMPGAVYAVLSSGLEKRVGDLPGLQAKGSPAGGKLLLSAGSRRAVSLSVYDLQTKITSSLPRGTLVDKCAWVDVSVIVLCAVPRELPLANYPDDWLLGRVHTADDLWFINTATGVATVAAELGDNTMDVGSLVVNEVGTYAGFIDRSTGLLWLTELQ